MVPDGRVLLDEADEAGRPDEEEGEPVAPAAVDVPEAEAPDGDGAVEDFVSAPGFADVVPAEE